MPGTSILDGVSGDTPGSHPVPLLFSRIRSFMDRTDQLWDGHRINSRGIWMIRLVVSDIDGTLFDSDEIITDEAVELVRKLHRHGISFS